MLPTITFPDIEALATAYVRSGLSWPDAVTVCRDVPNPRPARVVSIIRDGGPEASGGAEIARLRVNVWAPTSKAAHDLCRAVSALLRAWPDGDPVCRMRQTSGPSGVPEESGDQRRLMYFEALVRGVQS